MSKNFEIQRIVDLLSYDKDFQFWKIKTKITSIVDNFFNRYTSISINNRKNFIIISNKSDGYKMKCNEFNVTPSAEKEKWVSKSALRQYIDILEAFNILQKSEDLDNVYKIINKDFLDGNMNFESTNLIEIIITDFKNLEKQPKKIFYSVLVTYLSSMSEGDDSPLNLNTSRGDGVMTIDVINKYAKACGYDHMKNNFTKLGYTLDEVYKTILKMISSK